MPPVDRVGLFQGTITDFGVTRTRQKELPQLVVTFLATALYNDATEEWDDWSEFEAHTITGYFVLVTLDAHGNVVKCLNYDQVMEAVGWDGESYSSLAAMDLKDKKVQFRVQEDTYDGNTRLKAAWIAAEDAEVGLRKLSGKDLTKLDAEFGVASVKKSTPATPKKGGKKASAPKPPTAVAPKATAEKPIESCTEQKAYDACIAYNKDLKNPVPEEVLNDYWLSQIDEIATDPNGPTDEEWPKIRDAVKESCSIPF